MKLGNLSYAVVMEKQHAEVTAAINALEPQQFPVQRSSHDGHSQSITFISSAPNGPDVTINGYHLGPLDEVVKAAILAQLRGKRNEIVGHLHALGVEVP
jgi:hypothetical protein